MVQTGLTVKTAIDAIESNFRLFLRQGIVASGRGHMEDGLEWVHAWPAHCHNWIFATHLTDQHVDAKIEWVKGKIRAKDAPERWLVRPSSRPASLGQALERHGFRKLYDWAGMACELQEVNADGEAPEGFEVEIVSDEASFREWTEITTVNLLGGEPEHVPATLEHILRLAEDPRCRFFLGRVNGRGVATAGTFIHEGIVGLYFVAVRKEDRKRGYGSHVVLEALRQGQADGGALSILQATEAGAVIYHKLGYQTFCTFGAYGFDPGAPDAGNGSVQD